MPFPPEKETICTPRRSVLRRLAPDLAGGFSVLKCTPCSHFDPSPTQQNRLWWVTQLRSNRFSRRAGGGALSTAAFGTRFVRLCRATEPNSPLHSHRNSALLAHHRERKSIIHLGLSLLWPSKLTSVLLANSQLLLDRTALEISISETESPALWPWSIGRCAALAEPCQLYVPPPIAAQGIFPMNEGRLLPCPEDKFLNSCQAFESNIQTHDNRDFDCMPFVNILGSLFFQPGPLPSTFPVPSTKFGI